MKFIILIYIALTTTAVLAGDPLKGKLFIHCDNKSKFYDLDYSVEFMTNNEEFEAEVFRHKNSNSCNGKAQFAIG